MPWPAIDKFRKLLGKNKGLIAGLFAVAMERVGTAFPGAGWPMKVLKEIGKHGIERLLADDAEVADLKTAGQPFPREQLDQIDSWLHVLTTTLSGVTDRLDALIELHGNESDGELVALLKRSLQTHEDLAQQFDDSAKQIRYLTLSLGPLEEKLDEVYHLAGKSHQSLEEIKQTLAEYVPLQGELEQLRRVRPEALEAIDRAEELCLANHRDQAAAVLLQHCQQRGIGAATLCRQLGMVYYGDGNLGQARRYLEQAAAREKDRRSNTRARSPG